MQDNGSVLAGPSGRPRRRRVSGARRPRACVIGARAGRIPGPRGRRCGRDQRLTRSWSPRRRSRPAPRRGRDAQVVTRSRLPGLLRVAIIQCGQGPPKEVEEHLRPQPAPRRRMLVALPRRRQNRSCRRGGEFAVASRSVDSSRPRSQRWRRGRRCGPGGASSPAFAEAGEIKPREWRGSGSVLPLRRAGEGLRLEMAGSCSPAKANAGATSARSDARVDRRHAEGGDCVADSGIGWAPEIEIGL